MNRTAKFSRLWLTATFGVSLSVLPEVQTSIEVSKEAANVSPRGTTAATSQWHTHRGTHIHRPRAILTAKHHKSPSNHLNDPSQLFFVIFKAELPNPSPSSALVPTLHCFCLQHFRLRLSWPATNCAGIDVTRRTLAGTNPYTHTHTHRPSPRCI